MYICNKWRPIEHTNPYVVELGVSKPPISKLTTRHHPLWVQNNPSPRHISLISIWIPSAIQSPSFSKWHSPRYLSLKIRQQFLLFYSNFMLSSLHRLSNISQKNGWIRVILQKCSIIILHTNLYRTLRINTLHCKHIPCCGTVSSAGSSKTRVTHEWLWETRSYRKHKVQPALPSVHLYTRPQTEWLILPLRQSTPSPH
jgi:hypothetical protein